ncbi:MAG: chemotaxis response regulator protein-glutamate methylesterase [bacterium]
MTLRVLIADDAILFRRVLADALAALPAVEVVGSAPNGRLTIQKVRELKPDLLTLDIEMPQMDGLAVLEALRKSGERVEVIVVSALTRRGGDLTMRALEMGAFDFITKPEAAGPELSREALIRELAPRLRALAHRLEVRSILRGRPVAASGASPPPRTLRAPPPEDLAGVAGRMQRLAAPSRPELVLIGVSTGGPAALARLLPGIPGDLGVPLLIVQHMPPVFTQSLAESLAVRCAVKVREAVHGERAEPNTAYIAPGGRQMRIAAGPDGRPRIEVTDDPPENNCRPAVDYLFRSAAHHFPGWAMAVILTGMGSDGTLGLRLLKRHGCLVIAQDEATSVVYGMPKAAVDAGVVDAVLPLEAIAARIAAAAKGWKT